MLALTLTREHLHESFAVQTAFVRRAKHICVRIRRHAELILDLAASKQDLSAHSIDKHLL